MTQTQQIKRHLESGKPITPLTALSRYGCMRLASRVNDLRNEGMSIITRLVKRNGKRFAEYVKG